LSRLLLAFLILALPVLSFSEEKKAAPKKKPAAKKQAKKQPDQDWGRFSSTSKRDLDAADRKKAEKAAKK
jgi:hypothetical protein